MTTHAMVGHLVAATGLMVLSLALSGDAEAQGPNSQGPMTVERIHSGFVGAPEVKITTVDHHTSTLIGGYAGWLSSETLFIGGAGYWLANGSDSREMAYGGFSIGLQGGGDRRMGWSVKGLLGGGEATLVDAYGTYPPSHGGGRPGVPSVPQIQYVLIRQGFFVAEPEAALSVRLSRNARFTASVGYRAVDAEWYDYGRLSGAVGSFSLQVGGH